MVSMQAKLFLLSAVLLLSQFARAQLLPVLKIDPERVVVTGLSSGGMMATQLGIAYSSYFRGVGVFAGGIYGCGDEKITSSRNCLSKPEPFKLSMLKYLNDLEKNKWIEPLDNVKKQTIYLFRGTRDK